MDSAKNIIQTASGYTKGAITGAVGGFVLGVLFKSKPLYFAIGGFLIGGYIGGVISEANDSSKKIVFKNFSS